MSGSQIQFLNSAVLAGHFTNNQNDMPLQITKVLIFIFQYIHTGLFLRPEFGLQYFLCL